MHFVGLVRKKCASDVALQKESSKHHHHHHLYVKCNIIGPDRQQHPSIPDIGCLEQKVYALCFQLWFALPLQYACLRRAAHQSHPYSWIQMQWSNEAIFDVHDVWWSTAVAHPALGWFRLLSIGCIGPWASICSRAKSQTCFPGRNALFGWLKLEAP